VLVVVVGGKTVSAESATALRRSGLLGCATSEHNVLIRRATRLDSTRRRTRDLFGDYYRATDKWKRAACTTPQRPAFVRTSLATCGSGGWWCALYSFIGSGRVSVVKESPSASTLRAEQELSKRRRGERWWWWWWRWCRRRSTQPPTQQCTTPRTAAHHHASRYV